MEQQQKALNRAQMTHANKTIQKLWEQTPDVSLAEFAQTHAGILETNRNLRLAFLKDACDHRLTFDVHPLSVGKQNPVVHWAQADTLEDALSIYKNDTRQSMIWALPDNGIWADIKNLCQALNHEGVAPSKARQLRGLFGQLEERIIGQNDFDFSYEEKLVSSPIGGKGRLRSIFSEKSALLPHHDPNTVILFLWKGRGTLLLEGSNLKSLSNSSASTFLPINHAPITAYEIPEFCMLLMAPKTKHMGNPWPDTSYFGRALSRGFLNVRFDHEKNKVIEEDLKSLLALIQGRIAGNLTPDFE